jgi:inorganic pyrophosphatase
MANLTQISNQLDPVKGTCRAIIETPKGTRGKFTYDPEVGLFTLGGLLPEGMMFPFDFGFIPSTLAEDGDPLDVMVLMDIPTHVGCLVDIRIIGVLQAVQTEDGETERNDRLFGVAVHSYDHQDIQSISDVNKTLLGQVAEFFTSYNKQRGKKFKIEGVGGTRKAIQLLKQAMKKLRDASNEGGSKEKRAA